MYDAYGTKYTFFRQELTNLLYNLWATTALVVGFIWSTDFRKSITTSARLFPWWKLLIPAAFDGLADFLSSVGGPNTPGSWSVLLGQSSVFFTMAFSAAFLRTRFSVRQVLGACLVVLGASLAIFPELFKGSCNCKVGYVIIYFLSDVPQSASQVYKDYAFKKGDLNVFYLTCVVSWFQLAMTWAYLPLQTLDALGGFDMSSIPEVFSDGFKCFLGNTDIPVYNSDHLVTGYCGSHVPAITMVFSIAGFTAGILQLIVMKKGSATLSVLTSAVALPLSDLAFNWPALMRLIEVDVTSFSWYNLGGVSLVVVGFLAYSLRESAPKDVVMMPKAEYEVPDCDENEELRLPVCKDSEQSAASDVVATPTSDCEVDESEENNTSDLTRQA
eukprot:TRINITY_DN13500_c0_g1_i6.p1 TRINITY_DN13500_c0_g1~~TRINITY_DN13500_c0_g1_i6.p1  ORF type:complete len:386 (-),score=61.79 TRINITY_DN13500_c0_g1_i6:27-1184(-)